MGYRETYLQVDLAKIADNYKQLCKHVDKPVFAVIKDNAYAHGAIQVTKKLQELGCPYVCVANIDEALSLREAGIKLGILILGYTNQYSLAQKYNLTISITSLEHATDAKNEGYQGKVHLNIDTGMNRFGIKRIDEFNQVIDLLKDSCEIEGVYTHLYDADEQDSHMEQQLKRFYYFMDNCSFDFKWVHTSNSAGTIINKDQRSNASRVGLALYGISPVHTNPSLKPAMKLYSELVQVKPLFKGESVGYGGEFIAKEDGYVGIVPLGYGDGFVRLNQNRFVSINNHPTPIIGRICMDQFMVLLDEAYPTHTPVEIFGDNISLEHMANQLGMLVYEVLVLLNARLDCVYLNASDN